MTFSFDESRRALATLLAIKDNEKVIGAEELTPEERLFLMTTSAAKIMEYGICEMAGYDQIEALRGFEALVADMTRAIIRLCSEMRNANARAQ